MKEIAKVKQRREILMSTKRHTGGTFTAVGLDIGTAHITASLTEMGREGKPSILGMARIPSRGLRKGAVIQVDSVIEDITRVVRDLESSSGAKIRAVCASINGSHISGVNSNGIVAISGREVRQNDVDRVLEAARTIAIPSEREIFHLFAQQFVVDDQDGIRQPLGISGVRLEARVHIVTGSSASAQNIVNCVNQSGLTVSDIVVSPLAAGRVVLTDEERDLGVVLLDLGAGTTGVSVFRSGAICHTAVLPVGGHHITNDIATGLRTTPQVAETLKVTVGSASVKFVSRDEMVEVVSTQGRSPASHPVPAQPPTLVSRATLADIIEARVQEICSLVRREIAKGVSGEIFSGGIVLVGGGSLLPGIAEVVQQLVGLPVRIGSPLHVTSANPLVQSPQAATAVGLGMHALETAEGGRWYGGAVGPRPMLRRVGSWLSELF